MLDEVKLAVSAIGLTGAVSGSLTRPACSAAPSRTAKGSEQYPTDPRSSTAFGESTTSWPSTSCSNRYRVDRLATTTCPRSTRTASTFVRSVTALSSACTRICAAVCRSGGRTPPRGSSFVAARDDCWSSAEPSASARRPSAAASTGTSLG